MSQKSEAESHNRQPNSAKRRRLREREDQYLERLAIQQRMDRIKHKILVMSGKGGVGKTTVAVNLAIALAKSGKNVGLMDVDIHGPDVPKMIGVPKNKVFGKDGIIIPPVILPNLKVMSIALFMEEDSEAVIWRGPLKIKLITQFLKDVEWGFMDYLIIDAPPGTGDEPLSVCQLIEDLDGALIVTTPQYMSLLDVKKSITFSKKLNIDILGIIENLSGFVCPYCGGKIAIFKSGGGEELASETGVNFLGRIPIDENVVQESDKGNSVLIKNPEGEVAKAFKDILYNLKKVIEAKSIKEKKMRIAISTDNDYVSAHFGRCPSYTLVDIEDGEVIKRQLIENPEHSPGFLPGFLSNHGVDCVITGGMGMRAQSLFAQKNIQTIIGVTEKIDDAIEQFLKGTLKVGESLCDRGESQGHNHGDCGHR